MPAPEYIAASDSLLGLLQRGRGEGYRRALEISKAEAHDFLIQCIARDPRLDSQVESRAEYYAALAIEIDLPLEPLSEHLRLHDDSNQYGWTTSLTVDTLTELAKRNYRNAEEILLDYIQWGQWWNWPLNELLNLHGDRLGQRIAQAIEQHFSSDDTLDEAMRSWPVEQFVHLSRFSSRIALSVSKLPSNEMVDDSVDLTPLQPRELLELANEKNYRRLGKAITENVAATDVDLLVSHISQDKPFASHIALTGLAKIAPISLSQWLAELWLTIPEKSTSDRSKNLSRVLFRQGVSRALLSLPSEATLPMARNWVGEQDGRKKEIAEKLLQEHATIEDLQVLREALLPMLTDEDAEWRCFMVKAFYNLPDAGIVQELVDIFYHFRFSKGRSYAAEAIQITSPEFFAKTMAIECLWDCEEGTRELGAKFAPLESPEALNRIRHLAEDPFESEEVRNAAKARVECIT